MKPLPRSTYPKPQTFLHVFFTILLPSLPLLFLRQLSLYISLHFLVSYINETIQNIVFYIFLLSFMIFLGCIHIIVYIYNSFIFTAELIPLYEYPTICLYIHLLKHTWALSSFWLLQMWTFIYNILYAFILSFLLGRCSELE